MAEPAEHDTPEPVVRPTAHRWLWYAFGGRLPARHRGWVLFDTTTGTWWARHIARMLVQMSIPIALIMVFLPAPLGLRAAVAGGGGHRRLKRGTAAAHCYMEHLGHKCLGHFAFRGRMGA